MAHFLTNRGKLLLMAGGWNLAGGTAYKMGLLAGSSMPTAIDTAGEVSVLNTVADLLPSLATECTGGTYARVAMSRTNGTEDDANNRVNMDASDVVFNSGTNGQQTWGAFWFDDTVPTTDTTKLLMGVLSFASAITFNGSTVTVTITDLVRAS